VSAGSRISAVELIDPPLRWLKIAIRGMQEDVMPLLIVGTAFNIDRCIGDLGIGRGGGMKISELCRRSRA
jgi:hypothetical protein